MCAGAWPYSFPKRHLIISQWFESFWPPFCNTQTLWQQIGHIIWCYAKATRGSSKLDMAQKSNANQSIKYYRDISRSCVSSAVVLNLAYVMGFIQIFGHFYSQKIISECWMSAAFYKAFHMYHLREYFVITWDIPMWIRVLPINFPFGRFEIA